MWRATAVVPVAVVAAHPQHASWYMVASCHSELVVQLRPFSGKRQCAVQILGLREKRLTSTTTTARGNAVHYFPSPPPPQRINKYINQPCVSHGRAATPAEWGAGAYKASSGFRHTLPQNSGFRQFRFSPFRFSPFPPRPRFPMKKWLPTYLCVRGGLQRGNRHRVRQGRHLITNA